MGDCTLRLFTVLSTAIVDNLENFCWREALGEIVNVDYQECVLSGVDISLDLGTPGNSSSSTTGKSIAVGSGQHFETLVNPFWHLTQKNSRPLMHIAII